MCHNIKLDKKYYDLVCKNIKTFEIRYNDRNYKVGDYLKLEEYDTYNKLYTGRSSVRLITYILDDFIGLQPGYIVMSIADI